MRILGIDSSSMVASVAVVDDKVTVGEYTINHKKTHSQTLLPMIDELMKMIDIDISSVDAIAIGAGPGSFTGLRIGGATAKGLGQALNIPLIAVPTLAGMAYNLYKLDQYICPILDAKRNQVFAAIYSYEGDKLVTHIDQQLFEINVLVDRLEALYAESGKNVMFMGDGVPVFGRYIDEHMQAPHMYAPAHINRQKASSVAALGAVYYNEGKYMEASEFEPEYLRKSQAEMLKEGQRL